QIAFPWRLVSALAVFGIIVIFALQNTQSVDVNFLFWDFSIKLIVVITATMVLSVVFGDMIDWWWRRRKKKHKEEA
ncbi:MAG: LapA family protein, partial [Gemmatimonadetes bacterium]|nr:LapA family protein [Gemmatimonadota bacterium]